MQTIIIGFVFTCMVVMLFSVISSFRAGNLRVARETDDEVPLLVPSEAAELSPAHEQNTPLVATDEETEADGDSELEDSAHDFSSLSSPDSEVETDATAACSPREIDSAINPTVSKVESKDNKVDATKDELAEFEKDEGAEDENIETKHVSISGEHSLKSLNEQANGDVEDELEVSRSATDDWEAIESTELEKRFGAASTYASTMVVSPNVKSSSEALLQLYAFYKIATEGPCSNPQPSILQPTARAKWNEWQKLGSMPQEEAMQKYIAVLTEVNSTCYETYQKSKEPARVVDQNDRDSSVRW